MRGLVESRYNIIELLGEGGMGVVYKVKDRLLDRMVAIKFLSKDFMQDADSSSHLLREAQAASGLDHQNICTIHEISETSDGCTFIVMAYYEGETLRRRIEQGCLEYEEACEIIHQICSGISHAHSRGIIHRDIKAENILISSGRIVKILDFGLARKEGSYRYEHTGISGTTSYMSPEQLSAGNVDNRTDIWAIGVLMYEMLTGEKPFCGEVEQAVIYAILNEEPTKLSEKRPDLPGFWDIVIAKTLEKNPDERYETVESLIEDLKICNFFHKHNAKKSVVVLPFDDLSPNHDYGYFSDGLTEELITDFSQVGGLRVISRASAMAFKHLNKDIQTIRRQLKVDYVVEGSVRKDSDRMLITAQLIDAGSDSHVWAKKYHGLIDDIFDIQENVAKEIIRKMKISTEPHEKKLLSEHGITNIQAYECYLRARHFMWYFKQEFLRRAEDEVKRGLELTGPNELLYATLGWIYHLFVEIGVSSNGTTSYMDQAKECVDKVFALNPYSEGGLGLAGILCYRSGDFQQAVHYYKKAMARRTENPDVLQSYVYCCILAGHGDKIISSIELLEKIDPMTPISMCMRGFMHCMKGEFQQGAPYYEAMYKMSSENPGVRFFYAWVMAWNQKIESAIKAIDLILAETPGVIFAAPARIMKHTLLGEKETALKFVTPQLLGAGKEIEFLARFLMEFFAFLDEKEYAYNWTKIAIARGFTNYPYIAVHSPYLAKMRKEIRFQKIFHDLKMRWEKFQV